MGDDSQFDYLIQGGGGDLSLESAGHECPGRREEDDRACVLRSAETLATDVEVVQVVGPLAAHCSPGGSTLIGSGETGVDPLWAMPDTSVTGPCAHRPLPQDPTKSRMYHFVIAAERVDPPDPRRVIVDRFVN